MFEVRKFDEREISEEGSLLYTHTLHTSLSRFSRRQWMGVLVIVTVLILGLVAVALVYTGKFSSISNEDEGRELHVAVNISNPATLYRIQDERVVCMDGVGKGRYYVRRSRTQKKTWIIRFRAGPDRICYSKESCEKTGFLDANTFLPEEDEIESNGILSSSPDANPHFYDWNHVQPHYCTYDLWLGDDTEDVIHSYRFTGSVFIKSLIKELVEFHELASAEVVVVAAIENAMALYGALNWINEYLTGLNPTIQVVGLMDGNLFLDWNFTVFPEGHAYHWAPQPLVAQHGQVVWRAVLDARCSAQAAEHPAVCLNGRAMSPYFGVPLFISTQQFGSNQRAYYYTYDDYKTAAAEAEWKEKLLFALKQTPQEWGIYSSQCTSYSISDNLAWLNFI
jgi:hypothetical protein